MQVVLVADFHQVRAFVTDDPLNLAVCGKELGRIEDAIGRIKRRRWRSQSIDPAKSTNFLDRVAVTRHDQPYIVLLTVCCDDQFLIKGSDAPRFLVPGVGEVKRFHVLFSPQQNSSPSPPGSTRKKPDTLRGTISTKSRINRGMFPRSFNKVSLPGPERRLPRCMANRLNVADAAERQIEIMMPRCNRDVPTA